MSAAGNEFAQLVPYAINFSLVIGAAVYFGREPLKRFVFQRHERQKDLIESAAVTKKNAERRFLEIQDKMKRLSDELRKLEEEIVTDGKQEATRIAEKASQELVRIDADTKRVMANEVEQMAFEERRKILDLAVARAEKKISTAMKSEDHIAILKTAKRRIEMETRNG